MRKRIYILIFLICTLIDLSIAGTLFNAFHTIPLATPMFLFLHNPINIIQYAMQLSAPTTLWVIALAPSGILQIVLSILIIRKYQKGKKPTDKSQHGSAKWGKEQTLYAKGMGNDMITTIPLGMSIKAKYTEKLVNFKQSWELTKPGAIFHTPPGEKAHTIVIAATRGGKGISVVIPTLLAWLGSIFVYDIKGENYALTANARSKFSTIILMNPTSDKSAKFNPVEEIEKGDKEISQIQNMLKILSNPYGTDKIDHWGMSANSLLLGLLLHIIYNPDKKTTYKKSLKGLYELISKASHELFEEIIETKHVKINGKLVCHPEIKNIMGSFLAKEEKELSSIVSTGTRFLTLYADPVISRNTDRSDFSLNDLVNSKKPVTLYYVTPPSDQDRVTPFTRLFIEMLGKKLTENIEKNKHELLLLIDEFPSLGKMEYIEKAIAFFAGYGVYLMLIVQGFTQLESIYGKEQSIVANCKYRIMLAMTEQSEAQRVSSILGKETIETQSVTKNKEKKTMFAKGGSESTSLMGRELMTPSEIMEMPYTKQIVLIQNLPPFKLSKIMFFNHPVFKHLIEDWEEEIIKKGKKPYIHMIEQINKNLLSKKKKGKKTDTSREENFLEIARSKKETNNNENSNTEFADEFANVSGEHGVYEEDINEETIQQEKTQTITNIENMITKEKKEKEIHSPEMRDILEGVIS